MTTAAEIEALERATVAAVAPTRLETIPGWLIPLDDGPIGRAKSAAPLSHHAEPKDLARIEAVYMAAGLPPAFRIARAPGLEPLRVALSERGFGPDQPTFLQTAMAADVVRLGGAEIVSLTQGPDAAWAEVFSGEGFDPVDAAGRIKALSRSPDAVFAAAVTKGEVAAVGVASFGHGWAGVHGMRTQPSRRGEGLAGRVLAALAGEAQRRGFEGLFLQVEQANAPALALYRRAGFSIRWAYDYWRR